MRSCCVHEQAVAVEPLDVVALVGRAVAPDADVVLGHRVHELRARDRASEWRGVEVASARGRDVERAALQRRKPLARQRLLAVDQHRLLRADRKRLLRHGSMSGSSYWPRSAVNAYGTAPCSRIHASAQLVSSPPEKAIPTRSPTGSEPRITRVATSTLTGGSAGAASRSAALRPSRAATKTVLSPAMVPATSGSAASSIASARATAKPRGVLITSVVPE